VIPSVNFVTLQDKEKTMLTINQIAQMESCTHNSNMPSDIRELLNSTYYSESKKDDMPIGELSLPQFIRVLRKYNL